jgi:fructokinase
MVNNRRMRIGIDLGGTKIEGIALEDGREVARTRVPAPRGDYARTLAAIADLVEDIERTAREAAGARLPAPPIASAAASIGIGIPGTLSPATGLVKNANSTWLNGRPLHADLERRLGRPVRIANDANCFAISEATDGAGAGAEVVFGVIVGTGTGAGVVVRGQGLGGPNGVAGEWGHNPLPWPDHRDLPLPLCYCGKHGCVETYLSGPALTRDHERHTGTVLTAEEIAERAAAGDPDASATLARYASRMARALAGVINVLDPDVIVLGGGLSNIAYLYQEVPRLWVEWVFGCSGTVSRDGVRTRLLRARHGDSSGVRGAAWLW